MALASIFRLRTPPRPTTNFVEGLPELPVLLADEDEEDLALQLGLLEVALRSKLADRRPEEPLGEGHDVLAGPVTLVGVRVVALQAEKVGPDA